MSTALRIASVTHVLRDLLYNGLIDSDVAYTTEQPVSVTSLTPFYIEDSMTGSFPMLNIYMYRVSSNKGWQNLGYPSRNRQGKLINNPPLALDLHYLLSAYANKELQSEVLLADGMQFLQKYPVLPRGKIADSLKQVSIDGGSMFDNLQNLSQSRLEDQVEQIKVTPEPINTEEMSKLWTAFGAKYRPCTAYKVSVVLIESEEIPQVALPVDHRMFYSSPFQHPVIDKVLSQSPQPNSPIVANRRILAGYRLYIRGQHLHHENVLVQINGQPVATDEIRDKEISLYLPSSLTAGIQGVQIVHPNKMGEPATDHIAITSNVKAFVLSPKIKKVEFIASNESNEAEKDKIKVTLQPKFHGKQSASLILNELTTDKSPKGYRFKYQPAKSPDNESSDEEIEKLTESIEFVVSGIQPGKYLVRVQIDGAESPLFPGPQGNYDHPKITIT